MNHIVQDSLTRNGNGAGVVNGRGIQRRNLSTAARIALAADLATGEQHLTPSIKQSAAVAGVSPYNVRQELKARAARNKIEEQKQQSAERAGAIVGAWIHASDKERARAFQAIGVADVWDALARVVG